MPDLRATRLAAHWYFEPRAIEQAANGRLYVRLGVRLFKWYLPTSGDLVSRARGRRRIAPIGPDLVRSLVQHDKQTRSWEVRHIFGALSMLALTWWSISVHGKGSWPVLLGANLVINGYPILLQRYNRARLRSLLARLDRRHQGRSDDPALTATDRTSAQPPRR